MASEVTLDATFDGVVGSPSRSNNGGKKTWEELRRCVRESRKILTTLVSTIPSSFTFRNIETSTGHKTRIYFLGVPSKGRENTLLYVDVPSVEETNNPNFTPTVLDWNHLLDAFQSSSGIGQLSREEQLMRERKRLVIYGITSYEVDETVGKFLFPANNNLYVCHDRDPTASCVVPTSINSYCRGARLDPKLCPANTDLVAFIHDNDIWVTHLTSGSEKRLTFAHKGTGQLSTDPLSAGVPSFVIQEEFDRHTGYWWRPSKLPPTSDDISTYQILYEEVDESDVDVLNLFAPSTDDHGIDEYRYPRAGTANAKSSLKIVEFEVDKDGIILDTVIENQLIEPLSIVLPWSEYLVRAGWTPSCNFVHAQLLDRQQQRLSLILIPLQHFTPVLSDAEMSNGTSNLPPIQILYNETSDIWINTHDILHFLPQTDDNSISFIWASEKTSFRHLYLVTSQVLHRLPSTLSDVIMELEENTVSECPQCQILKEVTLTSGSWEVLSLPVWVDSYRKLVYFTGLKDTPLETHLYCVSYESPREPVRITHLGFSHSVAMNIDCTMYISVYSSIQQTPRATVNRIQHTNKDINARCIGVLMEHTVCPEFKAPEIFDFEATSGNKMYGMYYKPHNYEVGKKYPTVLYVYGGPQVQLVTNSFKGVKFLRLHTLASEGYAVIVLDSRGSSHRGIMFESILKHRLGTVEIDEQVEGLLWINSNVDFIDITRVAIHGWSYGGYLSLMGLSQRPEIFKLAIAGAPVVSWSLYDTGYTERYMGLPSTNIQAYKTGCVLDYIESFPDEENRLLIVHGLIDENVHFHHSNYLINTLVRYCKPYRLQVYPNERHGIRSHEASEHYKTMVLSFLQNNL
ncbi:hypothetical protein SNE40_007192 [Patella caerulea]|uniref:dipeptidyl-peptidase IV n=1 Tax=Patella caerulea TaxID=87958 RepID=A0AAN8JXF5_PATCE